MLTAIPPMLQTFAITCDKTSFLGLVSWDQFLDLQKVVITDPHHKTFEVCQIQNFNGAPGQGAINILGNHSPVLLIALAVLDDLIRIAALVAVGYIIYGGIQYINSQGSPDSTKKAQQTIINALIGVAVAITAASIVAFIGHRLGS